MRSRIVVDENGTKWKVWARAWYADKTGKQLFDMKQRAADEQRSKGRESYAAAIENKLWINWVCDAGLLTKKERII